MSKLFGHKLEPSFSLWRLEQKLFCTGTATKIEGRKWMGHGKYGLAVLKQCKVLCRSNICMRYQNAKDFTTAHRWLWYMGCGCHTYRRTNLNWIVLCRMKLFVPSRKLQLLFIITGVISSFSLLDVPVHMHGYSWTQDSSHHLIELVIKHKLFCNMQRAETKLSGGLTIKADETALVFLAFVNRPNWRYV